MSEIRSSLEVVLITNYFEAMFTNIFLLLRMGIIGSNNILGS